MNATFSVVAPTHVTIRAFDALGHRMSRPVDRLAEPGRGCEIKLDARDWPHGTYVVTIRTSGPGSATGFSVTRRIVHVR